MFDLHNNVKVLGDSITRVTDNTAQVVSIDRIGYQGLEFFILLGTLADADTTLSVLVEDSADNTNWAAVADDFLLGIEAMGIQFDQDNKTGKIGYAGQKRYARITVTPANNTGNIDIGILGLGTHPNIKPQTTQLV